LPDDNLDSDNIFGDDLLGGEVIDTSSLEGDGSNADDLLGGTVIDTSALEGDGSDADNPLGGGKTPASPAIKIPPPPAKTPAASTPKPTPKPTTAPSPDYMLNLEMLLGLLTASGSNAAMDNSARAKEANFDIDSFFQGYSSDDMDELVNIIK
jgi:pyruvate/2-oxoglutarate dehydrogenase complex dihydrolipoamide acyltransferase (E2) component